MKNSLAAQAGNVGMAIGFNLIGDWALGKYPDGSPQKVMAHALMGGLVAEATGSDFKTGALAAGANEALGNALSNMVGGDENLELMSSQLVGLLAAAAVDGDLEKGSEIAKYATAYNQQVHREARERLEYGLEILHAQGKYPGLDAETVLKDLRKIVDGDASSASDLNPEVVKFLNSEFTPASLRDTLLEPEPWEILASIALDLAPTPVGKVSAAQKIKGISKEVQQALEQKYGADLLLAAKGAVYRTNKEAKIAAEALGFSKVSETVHGGQAVYKKGGLYITRDLDGHNGGAWKMADSIKGLNSKRTRLGTYDVNLKRIGD